MSRYIFSFLILALVPCVRAGDLPKEADYYQIEAYDLPKGEVLEIGALELLPDGRLAVATRRGEIWMVHNALGPTKDAKLTRFAHGLHEILGLGYRDGWLYVTQRPEVT